MASQFPIPRTNWGAESRKVGELARATRECPRIPWDEFIGTRFTWQNEDGDGEHVSILGNTGGGKTHLMTLLLPLHPFVTVLATKPGDRAMDHLIEHYGYARLERWQKLDPLAVPRRILWPDVTSLGADEHQREVFLEALNKIYREKGWTIAVDETLIIANDLNLSRELRQFFTQGRSIGLSVIACTQRPRNVPLELYSQATHLFVFRQSDVADVDRLSDIGGFIDKQLLKRLVVQLEPFQVLYLNTRNGMLCRTKAPPPQKRKAV